MSSTLSAEDFVDSLMAFDACAKLIEDAVGLSKPRLSQLPANEATNKVSTLPSLVDFTCDFEFAARAVLSAELFLVFRACYLLGKLSEDAIPLRHRYDISLRVGSEVIRRGIYHHGYFYQHSSAIASEDAERQQRQRIAVAADARMRRRKELAA